MKRFILAVTSPIRFAARRPFATLGLTVATAAGVVAGASKLGVDLLPPPYAAQARSGVDELGDKLGKLKVFLADGFEKYFGGKAEAVEHEPHKIVATTPEVKDVVLTDSYVCQIHSQRHIDVRALDGGYLEELLIKEGQAVKKGDLMFRILPVLYKAKMEAEKAEAKLAQLEFNNTKMLAARKVVSPNEVLLLDAKRAKAQAQADLATAEMNFTYVKAPFDGIVDRQRQQLGSLIKEGDVLTTLSDNSVMWVYFNVPEAQYLEYMAAQSQGGEPPKIELELAGGTKFPHLGKIGAIESNFNNETGNIAFRADFPNPDRLLRHGQTGKVILSTVSKDAVVIPQRAAFDVLANHYVFIIDEQGKARQREFTIKNELEDVFVVNTGVKPGDKIILEGSSQVRDGEKVAFEFDSPEVVMSRLKNRAE